MPTVPRSFVWRTAEVSRAPAIFFGDATLLPARADTLYAERHPGSTGPEQVAHAQGDSLDILVQPIRIPAGFRPTNQLPHGLAILLGEFELEVTHPPSTVW